MLSIFTINALLISTILQLSSSQTVAPDSVDGNTKGICADVKSRFMAKCLGQQNGAVIRKALALCSACRFLEHPRHQRKTIVIR